jgi:hypothetical protein
LEAVADEAADDDVDVFEEPVFETIEAIETVVRGVVLS